MNLYELVHSYRLCSNSQSGLICKNYIAFRIDNRSVVLMIQYKPCILIKKFYIATQMNIVNYQ